MSDFAYAYFNSELENLDIPSKNDVISKQEANTQLYEQITKAIQEHVNIEDPHGILPIVAELISNMVKTDGSTPFTSPQTGVDPQSPQHLTTKKYVDQLIKQHIDTEDPHNILNQVQNYLQEYVKNAPVFGSISQLVEKAIFQTAEKSSDARKPHNGQALCLPLWD